MVNINSIPVGARMITVKVFPTLRVYLPPEILVNAGFPLELPDLGRENVRVKDLIDHLKIPKEKVNMAIINGKITRDFNQSIKDGDVVSISPPIAGG